MELTWSGCQDLTLTFRLQRVRDFTKKQKLASRLSKGFSIIFNVFYFFTKRTSSSPIALILDSNLIRCNK